MWIFIVIWITYSHRLLVCSTSSALEKNMRCVETCVEDFSRMSDWTYLQSNMSNVIGMAIFYALINKHLEKS